METTSISCELDPSVPWAQQNGEFVSPRYGNGLTFIRAFNYLLDASDVLTLETPQYPICDYPSGTVWHWVFRAPRFRKIRITFISYDIFGPCTTPKRDYVQLTNVAGSSSATTYHCGVKTESDPDEIEESVARVMRIKFRANSDDDVAKGFKIQIEVV